MAQMTSQETRNKLVTLANAQLQNIGRFNKKQLAESLKISQPTVARLMREMGIEETQQTKFANNDVAKPSRKGIDAEFDALMVDMEERLIEINKEMKSLNDEKSRIERKLKALKHAIELDD